ncbi:MAG: hypothetical protein OEO84_16615, partial [Betaproteobacteria bacterium]|nr:hypothetical protein [Betaproteobacteria bacterium]
RNYDGAYALHVPNPGVGGAKAAFAIGALSGTTDRTARISATHVSVPAWSQGLLETAGANPLQIALSFDRNATNTPDGPFAATSFGIAPADSDGVILPGYDLDVDNNAINDHLAVGTTDVRFGRLVMQSIYGPANRDLPVTLEAQYWDGTSPTPGFTRNTADSCTRFLQSDFGLTFAPAPVPAAPDLVACETAMLEANITFASGRATLTMAKPGLANPGTVRLTANLDSAGGTYCPAIGAPGSELPATNAAKGYLRGKWDDGAAYDDKPSASAGFGLFGSQPKNFIFLRENY